MPTPPPASHELPPQVFLQAVEQAALAISITDARANILYANPAFERVTGYAREEIVGHNESILSYKVTPKLVYETLWAQLKRQRAWNGLLVNRRKDGSRYLADLTITPVVDAEGRSSHFLGMHRDVTEVHRLERQVQNQKALIESVVDSAQVAICLLDERDRVVLDNQEYKKLIGDLGSEPASTLLTALRGLMGTEFDQSRAKRRPIAQREVLVERPNRAPRWFACAISWFEEQDGSADAFYEPLRHRYLLLTAQDISEVKQQQETLRVNALRTVLGEQERIQGLRETLAGAVFQLEGPLNMLAATLKMLERKFDGNAEEHAAAALDSALGQARAALDTLRACVPEALGEAPSRIDLNEMLRDLLKIATPRLLAAGIVVDWRADDDLPGVPGSASQVYTLFKQLIDNAIDALGERRAGERLLRIRADAGNDHVEVRIEDNGPGIPAEWRYKVFEPFFTTKGADHQHLGMGLSMAQEAVTRHGGLIDFDTDYRPGCRVRVQLPLAGGHHG